jgi:DNA-binding FrmR family transcriptional regulator
VSEILPKTRQEVEKRLNKIGGQISGIRRMVAEDRYCVDILIQIAATRAALDKVGRMIMKGHMESCVAKAIKGNRGQELIDELDDVMSRFMT